MLEFTGDAHRASTLAIDPSRRVCSAATLERTSRRADGNATLDGGTNRQAFGAWAGGER